jgi:hypothetical protein
LKDKPLNDLNQDNQDWDIKPPQDAEKDQPSSFSARLRRPLVSLRRRGMALVCFSPAPRCRKNTALLFDQDTVINCRQSVVYAGDRRSNLVFHAPLRGNSASQGNL